MALPNASKLKDETSPGYEKIQMETNMAQPQMARFSCDQCKAWYSSDRELRDHMQAAHPKFVSENSLPESSAQADSAKQGCAASFLMEERGEIDKLCGRTPAEQEEYVQPDKEKEAGGEG